MNRLRHAPWIVVLAAALAGPALAQENSLANALEYPVRLEPEIPVTSTVVRSAPFTGGSGFGCTEDTSTGEILFSEINNPFLVEVRTKDLVLVRTLNIPNPGLTMTGIAYDPKNDTLWCASTTTVKLHEFNKQTGVPTGAFVIYSGGIVPGAVTIDINDGNGGDTAYVTETWLDRVDSFDIRTGSHLCTHFNPLGQPVFGNGISYVPNPRFPGELYLAAGANSAGQVTDVYRGNPCVGQEYVDPLYVANLGNECFPNGYQATIDTSVVPNEVFYFMGNATGTLYEIHAPMTVDDCQGIDGENVLFVNGSNAHNVNLVEGWPFHFGIWKPSGGGNGKYVVHLNVGHPHDLTITGLPVQLGDFCFPILLPPYGTANPSAVWNNLGQVAKVGSSNWFGTPIPNPPTAPAFFHESSVGDTVNLPAGSKFTLQGLILNPGSTSPKNASVTNAIAITVDSQP